MNSIEDISVGRALAIMLESIEIPRSIVDFFILIYRITGYNIVLELMETSNTISTFKKRKTITLPIRFTTIRNLSLQKNLSISA